LKDLFCNEVVDRAGKDLVGSDSRDAVAAKPINRGQPSAIETSPGTT
jgi:hypothetical protein